MNQADCASDDFPTLDADLGDDLRERSGTAKRICIATPDILGPVKNGGIGTAYHHLARLLAEWGHEVVIAYVAGNAADARLMEEAHVFYAGFGVAFEPIAPRPAAETALAQVAAPAWALYDWLRACKRPFDIVHVSDWHGLGYGALLAKSLGLAFGATHFIVHGHGPVLWNVEGNRQLLSKERELGWVFMERRSVELADTVICGSAHLLGWMREAGYAMPARSFVWPNPFPVPDPSPDAAAGRAARDGAALWEVVFFGRLEPRKGLVLFVDAIERLACRDRAPARVTFLGKASPRIDGPEFIRSAARDWPVEVRTITDFGAEEAVAYLSRPGRLAVLPSLQENSSLAVTECLQAGIPFVAAATGGTPELVAPEDRARALVSPDHVALSERIAELDGAPLRAVRPRWDFTRSIEVWSRWHARSAPFETSAERFAQRAHIAGAETPLVTVCIVHHERPALVRMAVDSVLAQDYPALEAVLVDDGSESAEALEGLDAIEAEFAERGWRVVRQDNRFKGAARNTAAAAARGEWLLFLDDDNVLFPDAASRLVRAARFSGAHCVPASSIRFFGESDPRINTESHGTPIRFLGAARAWNRFRNVAGDACVLVRRDAFEAVGGFSEEYRVGLEDLSFLNRLLQTGRRIEPIPDPAYYYRFGKTSTRSLNRSAEAAQVRVLAPYLQGLPVEERAFCSFAVASINAPAGEAEYKALAEAIATAQKAERKSRNLSKELEASRRVAAERKNAIRSLSAKLESSRQVAAERKSTIESLSGRLDNSRHTAAERRSTIESLSGRLDNSRRVAAERKNAIWSLSGKLESSRQVATERKSTIESLSGKLESSRQVATERKSTIESLSGRLDNSRRVAAERKNAIRSLSDKLESSRRTAAERKSTIRSLSGRLESSRRVAAERKNAIRSLSDKLESSRRTAAERKNAIERLSNELEISRTGHVMALAHRRFRFGTDELEVNLLLNPEWIDQARQWRDREPILELRRNGRIVARAYRRDLLHSLVRIAASTRIPAAGDALYSFHDISTGKALAALSAPAFWQARRVIGAVESRPRPEVFGWVLDPSNPERGRRIAVHVDRRLHEVIDAQRQRVEPGRGKERTGGRHEFRWPIPKGLAAKDGARIDVFDADTGRPLRGSPAHLEGGQVVVSG